MFKKFKQYRELLFLIITLLILVILQKMFFPDENYMDIKKENYEEENEGQEIPEDFSNPGQYQLFCKDGRGNFGGSLEFPTFMRTGICEQCL